MKKALFAICAALITALTAETTQTVKVDDRTNVKVTVKKDGILVNWDCAESNMKYVSDYYKTTKVGWDFYKGENIDCFFSPHSPKKNTRVSYPAYRVMGNPGKYFFFAFLAKSRPNHAVRQTITQKADRWQAEWFFPFAAMETFDFRNDKKVMTFVTSPNWTFQFIRRSQSSGKNVETKSPVITVSIPKDQIKPYTELIFAALGSANKGKAVYLSAAVRNYSAKEFTGKVNYYLHKGNEVTLAKTYDLKVPAKGSARIGAPIPLPELAVKFSGHIEVLNQEGTPIRISPILPIENPWVDFK
ncbi:MAG: hypothetical protein IKB25_14645 [Lentisphaeria bacterium]|nr:hypothetical protein [Lentisphaeria bacterium]